VAEFKELEREKSVSEEEPENEAPVSSNEAEQPKEKEDDLKTGDTPQEN